MEKLLQGLPRGHGNQRTFLPIQNSICGDDNQCDKFATRQNSLPSPFTVNQKKKRDKKHAEIEIENFKETKALGSYNDRECNDAVYECEWHYLAFSNTLWSRALA